MIIEIERFTEPSFIDRCGWTNFKYRKQEEALRRVASAMAVNTFDEMKPGDMIDSITVGYVTDASIKVCIKVDGAHCHFTYCVVELIRGK